jgi:hypothetical protein
MDKLSPGQYGPYTFNGRRYNMVYQGGVSRCATVSLRSPGGTTLPVHLPPPPAADAGVVPVGQPKGQYYVVVTFQQPSCGGSVGFRPAP